MGDSRVNIFAKILPIVSIGYFLWPLDILPGVTLPIVGALDDAAVLWLGTYLFVELCPPDVVEEHLEALGLGHSAKADTDTEEEVVDVEAVEVTEDDS